MTTLHDRLVSAVTERLELARAAAKTWTDIGVVVEAPDGVPFVASDATVAYIGANSPGVTIRACEADLRRLERHRPWVRRGRPLLTACTAEWADGDGWIAEYPCNEITDLAASLGVAVDEGDET